MWKAESDTDGRPGSLMLGLGAEIRPMERELYPLGRCEVSECWALGGGPGSVS